MERKQRVDARSVNCRCCGETMDRKEGRLCQVCEREGCDPATKLCHQDIVTDGGHPEEPTDFDLIGAAADEFGVDLDRAITAIDADPESTRIYLLVAKDSGYSLVPFGLDADGDPIDIEEPMHIPESAVTAVQGLLFAASLHQAEISLAEERDREPLGLVEVAESMGVAGPVEGDG